MSSVGYIPNYVAAAVYQLQLATNPTAPASTSSATMQGIGALFTPVKSGNCVAFFSATINAAATTVGNGISLTPYCGLMLGNTAAPANAAAVPNNAILLAGISQTQTINTQQYATGVTLTTAADSLTPIVVAGLARNLQLHQQYWFDLSAEAITTASDNQLTQVYVTIVEI